MNATIHFTMTNKPEEHTGVCYMVEVGGDGRGLFCTADRDEAEELARRVNDYPALKAELEKTRTANARLLKRIKTMKEKVGAE